MERGLPCATITEVDNPQQYYFDKEKMNELSVSRYLCLKDESNY